MYRCGSGPGHPNGAVHGYIYERSGSPIADDEFVLTGTFTIPRPVDSYLLNEINRYHEKFKKPYTAQAQEDFIQEYLKGGMTTRWGKEFLEEWKKTPHPLGARISRDMVRWWLHSKNIHVRDELVNEVWGMVQWYWMEEKQQAEQLKEKRKK